MRCPSCRIGTLVPVTSLDKDLSSHQCKHCDGHWLCLNHYLHWRSQNEPTPAEDNPQCEIIVARDDTRHVMLCPVSETFMTKYRISAQTEHRLDYSLAANAVWMDKGEWQLLVKEGIAGVLTRIFTAPWQRKVRLDSARQSFADMYASDFGEDNYHKLAEIRRWLEDEPMKNEMLAYLAAVDPYRADQ